MPGVTDAAIKVLEKERATIRAALTLTPMNSTLRTHVLALVDRHFERAMNTELRIASAMERIEAIERNTTFRY